MRRNELEGRIAALSAEIRQYPTPIARCDQHLAALLDERASLVAELQGLCVSNACPPDATWTNDGGFNAA